MSASGVITYFLLLGGGIGLAAGLMFTLRAVKLI
ncbi:MAG: cytochrome b6-f complex subunit PetL [Actinomycetota bacterium]